MTKANAAMVPLVESRDKDWLRVGALLSVKSHDATTWQMGIVRRLSRVNDDTSSVGIETLAETPILAMLYDTTTPGYTVNGIDNIGANLPHPSLWLAGSSGADSVIIDPVHFMPGKVFEIHGAPERKFIALGNPIERSEGWMRVIAEPVKRLTAARPSLTHAAIASSPTRPNPVIRFRFNFHRVSGTIVENPTRV